MNKCIKFIVKIENNNLFYKLKTMKDKIKDQSQLNKMSFHKNKLMEIIKWLNKIQDKYPFQQNRKIMIIWISLQKKRRRRLPVT